MYVQLNSFSFGSNRTCVSFQSLSREAWSSLFESLCTLSAASSRKPNETNLKNLNNDLTHIKQLGPDLLSGFKTFFKVTGFYKQSAVTGLCVRGRNPCDWPCCKIYVGEYTANCSDMLRKRCNFCKSPIKLTKPVSTFWGLYLHTILWRYMQTILANTCKLCYLELANPELSRPTHSALPH